MFYYLKGNLQFLFPDFAVIDAGGVGYKLTVSKNTFAYLSPLYGKTAMLFTHMAVREDAVELYGFGTEDELSAFKHLITVSGVGPKAAINVLSTFTADGLASVRNEFARLMADKAHLEAVMKAGSDEAAYYARKTMSKVRRKIGFVN